MAATNANTAAQWQQAKDSLVSENNKLFDTATQLDGQKSSLISKAGDLSRQINATSDPVQKAQLQAEHANVMSDVKQVNSQIAQNNTDLQKNGDQLATANTEINNATNGAANLNSTTPPVGSDAKTSVPAASEEKTLASDLTTIKERDGSYTVVDNERGLILYATDNPDGANKYISGVANGASHQDAVNAANIATANPTSQQTPAGDATSSSTTTTNQALDRPPVGDVGSQPPVVPVVVETSKPEQTVTTESSTTQTAKPENSTDQKTVTSADDSNHGTAYDDDGNLNNGWAKNENGDAVWVGAGYNDATGQTAARTNTIASNNNEFVGPAPTANPTKATASAIPDWRVKLSLAKNATGYLYSASKPGEILYPLKLTGGVVFPYTPQINTAYKANYDSTDLTHSNYRMQFYKSSHVDDVQITCDFTAQDAQEASYVLAVIHFFKSVTKMFYGQDKAPAAGTPPPLVYLSGYGQYQFNNHPMLISSFTYNLPNDVDYIRASTGSALSLQAGAAPSAGNASYVPGLDFIKSRLLGANLNKGGATSQPSFTLKASGEPTYVPTKIQIQLTCLPVVTRNDISKEFSLKEYAAGNLFKRSSGGIW